MLLVVGLIGVFHCSGCGYRSRPILLGAGGQPYELALGECVRCREILVFDVDWPCCGRCGDTVVRLVQDEEGSILCPQCDDRALLIED